jgi:hypothetical protein
MKRFIVFLVLGISIGTFSLHAEWKESYSFGISGAVIQQEGDFSDELWSDKKDQTRSMFLLGFCFDTYYFWGNLPLGFFGTISLHLTPKVSRNGRMMNAWGLPVQAVLGPAFYFDISKKTRITAGLGMHLSILLINAMNAWADEVETANALPEYPLWEVLDSAGIGGKVNVDFALNDHRLKAVGFLAAESRIEAKAS